MLRRNFILATLFSLAGCRCSTKHQLKIGDRVTNNRLGPNIVGIITDIDIKHKPPYSKTSQNVWLRFYPNFSNYPVATVKLDKPSKSVTLEQALSCGYTKLEYEKCPYFNFLCYPVQDLERV